MNQNLEKPVTDFSFFIAPDKNLVMRCPTGFAPVAAFTTVLRVDDSVVHASFALDDNGNLQHSNFPFETLSVSIRHQRVYINGLPGSPIGRDDGMDTRSIRTQGIITALIPSPRGNGNQYLSVFIGQKPGKRTRIYCCSGSSHDVFTIYSALTAISNASAIDSSSLNWKNA